MTESDIDLIAETGASICHHASSNLKFQSGIAPLNRFLDAGVKVAMRVLLTPEEQQRCSLSRRLFPHVKQFYQDWLTSAHTLHYCQNARD